MFGRRTRKHTQALEDLREEFSAADRHAKAVLTDAIAQIELRMAREREDRDATRLTTEIAIENAQSSLTAQAKDVGVLLQQVADTCALVVERVEADRVERRAFTDAIARLMQSTAAPVESGERPLGGTVLRAPEITEPTEPRAEPSDTGVPARAEAPPADNEASPSDDETETIDLRAHEEAERTSRILPRWATKRS